MGRSRRCCCVFSLKAGTSLLLWWTIVSYLTFIVAGVIHRSNYPKQKSDIIDNLHATLSVWILSYQVDLVFWLNLFSIFILVSVAGLYGICMNKPKLLIPYILYRSIADFFTTFVIFPYHVELLLEFKRITSTNHDSKIPVFVESCVEMIPAEFSVTFLSFLGLELLFITMEVYFIWMIYSCYKMMRERAAAICTDVIPLSSPRHKNNNKIPF